MILTKVYDISKQIVLDVKNTSPGLCMIKKIYRLFIIIVFVLDLEKKSSERRKKMKKNVLI